MGSNDLNIVTGATGYTGKYITQKLLSRGYRVKSLTGHLKRENPFGEKVSLIPFSFENPQALAKNLQGATKTFAGVTDWSKLVSNSLFNLEAVFSQVNQEGEKGGEKEGGKGGEKRGHYAQNADSTHAGFPPGGGQTPAFNE